MQVFVYILRCGDGGYYTGMTKCLPRRLKEHADGKSKSTKRRRPLYLAYITETSSYREGRKVERYIKRKGARRFLQDAVSKEGVNF